jgi:hypothetical protein
MRIVRATSTLFAILVLAACGVGDVTQPTQHSAPASPSLDGGPTLGSGSKTDSTTTTP